MRGILNAIFHYGAVDGGYEGCESRGAWRIAENGENPNAGNKHGGGS